MCQDQEYKTTPACMEHEIQKRKTRTMLKASSLGAYKLIKATIEGSV
jgi:hypothetical protein